MRAELTLTDYGKRQIGLAMVQRGEHFLGGGLLVKRQGGNRYVVLYLLCQGLEVTLKGFLLLKDYDGYRPRLKGFGHDLIHLADEAAKSYGLSTPRGALRQELGTLNAHYVQHRLRYASGLDLLVDPDGIAYSRVLRRIYAASRLAVRSGLIA